jgi:hypothetical protein
MTKAVAKTSQYDSELETQLVQTGMDKNEAVELLQLYGMPLTEAGEILKSYEKIKVTDESQVDVMVQAREMRLKLRSIRVAVDKRHDELKVNVLKSANAIDFVNRTVKQYIEPAETYLKFQEEFSERVSAERRARIIAERTTELSKYIDDLSIYNLGEMNDAQFADTLEREKTLYDLRIAKEKAAEVERIKLEKAEEVKRQKVFKENERLRAEAKKKQEETDKKLAAERAKADEERKKREAIEQELELKRVEADAAKRAKEEAEKKAALAPDKEKLLEYISFLDIHDCTELTSGKAEKIYNQIKVHLSKSVEMYRNLVEKEL